MSKTLVSAATQFERTLTDSDTAQYLTLYKPEYVHIREAKYLNRRLQASFGLYSLDFHRRPLAHLSRVQITHYLGQAAFTLGGCMASEGLLQPLAERDFIKQVELEACTFRQLHLQFRRYLPNADGTTITMSCERQRRSANAWLFDLRFELNDGDCFGSAHAFVPFVTRR